MRPGAEPQSTPVHRRWPKYVLVLLTFPIAFYLGAATEYHQGAVWDHLLAPAFFGRATSGFDTASLQDIWSNIQQRYAKENVSPDAAITGADKGLVKSLNDQFGDRFSAYLTPEELRRNQEFLSGSFGGIGASMLGKAKQLVISAIVPGTPAAKAGLKANDVLLRIDGRDATSLSVDAAVTRIRGAVGTHVKLTVARGNQLLDFDLVRANISVPSVRSRDFPGGILYVRLYEFGEHSGDDIEAALKEGFSRGDKKVILDLRQNPGGYVATSDQVASEFIKDGLNVTLVGRGGKREEHRVSGKGVAFTEPLVVLVDEQSASASEILSGALKDNNRAFLVGKKTFGKGSVQEDFQLRNGGDLHLTVAYWYTPRNVSIERNGITPDLSVDLSTPESFYEVDRSDSNPAGDAQLQAAIKHLN
ncbi:MAG: S41 family peptidase [Candidatus Dormibacteria bacterium]